MNLIILEADEVDTSLAVLADHRATHIVKVLGSRRGDRVKVGIVNGKIGYGIIKEVSAGPPWTVLLEITPERDPAPKPPIDFIVALPRPIMFKRILSQLTALGCGHIHVVNANRVEKSFWDAAITGVNAGRKYLIEGLEQAGDTRLPHLSFHKGFKPFIEKELAHVAPGYKQMLVADPGVVMRLSDVFQKGPGRVLVAVGPEGGWVDYELQRFAEIGFVSFRIGERILKVETAVTAVHAMVSQLHGG